MIEREKSQTKSIEQGLTPYKGIEKLLLSGGKIPEVAEVYAKVFAGWPWFEVSKGPECGKFYGPDFEVGAACPCGCGALQEAYPKEETVNYIFKELSRPLLNAFIYLFNQKVGGFGWGYQISGKEFVERKYNYDLAETRKVFFPIFEANDLFFYISEVGVLPSFQGKKIGTQITNKLANTATQSSLPILMRTNENSPMVKIAKNLEMKVILGKEINLLDPENPERVLFTSDPKEVRVTL